MSKAWFITGVSTGFGLQLAEAVLERGERVVGSLRRADQVDAFEALAPGRARAVLADVTDRAAVERAVNDAISWSGGLDVVVNNAGYGLVGAFEELSPEELDAVMATNFFGTANVIRAVLPHLRTRGRADLVNISSMAGLFGLPGYSGYNASKFAVEGLSEALRHELAPFGIRVMAVEPGAFRTDFRHGTVLAARQMEAYRGSPGDGPRAARTSDMPASSGDPTQLCRRVLEVLDQDELPMHLIVGDGSHEMMIRRYEALAEEVRRWQAFGEGTSYGGD